MSVLTEIYPRIKYYLLDWKDQNLDEYLKAFDHKSVHDMTKEELIAFYEYVTDKEKKYLRNK